MFCDLLPVAFDTIVDFGQVAGRARQDDAHQHQPGKQARQFYPFMHAPTA